MVRGPYARRPSIISIMLIISIMIIISIIIIVFGTRASIVAVGLGLLPMAGSSCHQHAGPCELLSLSRLTVLSAPPLSLRGR